MEPIWYKYYPFLKKELQMLFYEQMMNVLFSCDEDKKLLVSNVQGASNFEQACNTLFFELSERELQQILAPFLRKLAVEHLRSGMSTCASKLRTAKQNDTNEDFETFLRHQGTNKVWATDELACCLADILQVNLSITLRHAGRDGLSYTTADFKEGRPGFQIYNDTVHWYVNKADYNGTLPDGNCLYNGFAQFLRAVFINEKKAAAEVKSRDTCTSCKIPEALLEEVSLCLTQEALLEQYGEIEAYDVETVLAVVLSREEKRTDEQRDYLKALEIATNVLPLPMPSDNLNPDAPTSLESSRTKHTGSLPSTEGKTEKFSAVFVLKCASFVVGAASLLLLAAACFPGVLLFASGSGLGFGLSASCAVAGIAASGLLSAGIFKSGYNKKADPLLLKGDDCKLKCE